MELGHCAMTLTATRLLSHRYRYNLSGYDMATDVIVDKLECGIVIVDSLVYCR